MPSDSQIHAGFSDPVFQSQALDPRNFIKKLASLGVLKKLNEKRSIGGHRSPFLYKFNKRTYTKALKEEASLVF